MYYEILQAREIFMHSYLTNRQICYLVIYEQLKMYTFVAIIVQEMRVILRNDKK